MPFDAVKNMSAGEGSPTLGFAQLTQINAAGNGKEQKCFDARLCSVELDHLR